MKKLLLFCVLFGLNAFSQNGIIKGKITDKLSEKPLQGVTVILINVENNSALTDENGNFTLQNVPIGPPLSHDSYRVINGINKIFKYLFILSK